MSAVATPTDHVNIEIDGVATTAAKGSMIIHAADRMGVSIPRFCYHDKLSIAANCRMCLVDVEKAPKPMPACATPVMEGMKVYTQSKRALDSQRNVMEFLLINHPLDCPICDQGGECELQDVAMGYGQSVSRFVERKRVVADEDMGPLIATDMTRCIHCTRCVRFVAEIAGTYELGGMSRGENLSIGTYIGKNVSSELSGNIIDVCPVGALTNKPFRFRARAWELTARPSIGYHDALGSHLFLHLRRGEVLRSVPRDCEAINESWLSDRDRYSHAGLQASDRVTVPMLRDGGVWREVSWEVALARTAELLREARAEQLGILANPATSNEEGALLSRLAQGLGCRNLDHRIHELDFADAPVAQPFEANLAEVEAADVILLLGCNPRLEAPILGHRVRKASKRGAKIATINPVAFDLHFELAHSLVVTPTAMLDSMLGVLHELADGNDSSPPAGMAAALASASSNEAIKALVETLRSAKRLVVVLGESAQSHGNASWLRALARQLSAQLGGKLNLLPQGANAVGLASHGVLPSGLAVDAQLQGACSTFVLYGIEPDVDFANGGVAQRALAQASSVVAFAAFAPESLKAVAEVILPIGLIPEIDATLTNVHGDAQTVAAAAKLPGASRPGWRVLRALGEQMGLGGFSFPDLQALRASLSANAVSSGSGLSIRVEAPAGLQRVATTAIYASDAVVRRAAPLQAHVLKQPVSVTLHADDATRLGLSQGVMVRVDDGAGVAVLPVVIGEQVARGAAWVERGHVASGPLAPAGSGLRLEAVKA
ncbi:MAG: NADH-quinone oxidoreductase subunit NuoG [Pseudomarimonas sp.]